MSNEKLIVFLFTIILPQSMLCCFVFLYFYTKNIYLSCWERIFIYTHKLRRTDNSFHLSCLLQLRPETLPFQLWLEKHRLSLGIDDVELNGMHGKKLR